LRKYKNWHLLNKRVISKIGKKGSFKLSSQLIHEIVEATPGAIELVLIQIKHMIEEFSK
jgi:hypothetical protein